MAILSKTSASMKPLDLESLIFGCALSAWTVEGSHRMPGENGATKSSAPKKCPENLGRSENAGEENFKVVLKMSTSAWTEDDRGAFYACSIVRQS